MRPRPIATMTAVALLAAFALAASGCGGSSDGTTGAVSANPPAAELGDRVLVSGHIPHVKPTQFAGPTAAYKRYVGRRLAKMGTEVRGLEGAVAAGALAAARRAWLQADASYESIGAAYGAFGELDAHINGEPAGLEGGVNSPEFIGLHRIEMALFGRRSVAEAAPFVPRLAHDVDSLRGKIAGLEIEPLEYVLRAHEVFEGSLDLQLSGRASPWSSDALVALRSNLRGTRVVVGSLKGLIGPREPLLLGRIDRKLSQLETTLRGLSGPGGTMPRWDHLPAAQKTLVAGETAGAAEQLAFVPEVVDPLPLRPERSALGEVQAE